MRIRRVALIEFRRVFDPPLWNPATVWRERRAPILVLETDDGLTGLGEAWCRQDEIGRSFAALRRLAQPLLGRAPDELQGRTGLPPTNWAEAGAASAVDMALVDLAARVAGVPVAALAGSATRPVPVYASGGLYGPGKGPAQLADELAGYVAAGFTAVKMKVGGLPLAEDLARVAAAREAIGGAVLIVDGVERYRREDAATLARRLADLGVAALQAPLPADDLEGLATLARASPIPLVLGEAEFDHGRLLDLVRSGAAGWLQANPGLAGGPTGMARLARAAAEHGVPLSPQCHATAILQAAAIHAGTLDGAGLVEHHRVHDHLHGLLPAALRRPVGGRIAIPPLPGFGIRLPAGPPLRPVLELRL